MNTGYYGWLKGNRAYVSKVHLQSAGRTLCGKRPRGEFHYLSDGARMEYVTCPKCRQAVVKKAGAQ